MAYSNSIFPHVNRFRKRGELWLMLCVFGFFRSVEAQTLVTNPPPFLTTNICTGPTSQRLNIVVLGDGYTSNQIALFQTHVTNMVVNSLFNKEPYNAYSSYFNVFSISVASLQEGSDHPESGVYNDTYFDSTYNWSGIQRLLMLQQTDRAYNLLFEFVPDYNIVIVLVNDSVYGGSGGAFAVTSINEIGPDITFHELGHSFSGLADEYDSYTPGYFAYEGVNCTAQTNRTQIRWAIWINEDTPVPTPETYEYADVAGLFEGCMYTSIGWYRPHLNSFMRSVGQPTGQINCDQIVKTFYQTWPDHIEPFVSFTPTNRILNIGGLTNLEFMVSPMQPVSHNLAVAWYLDGTKLTSQTKSNLVLSSYEIGNGIHAVSNCVSDLTPLVRIHVNDFFPVNPLAKSVSWTLDISNQTAVLPVITTTLLSAGIMNVAYTGTLTAIHGILPYTWSIINGSLPPGLTLNPENGAITGTPTAAGTFSFTAQVSDAGDPQQTASKPLSISVAMSIWSNTTVPIVVDAGPDKAVELGIKFKSDVVGTIAGIRFYKAAANTNIHVGNLWTSNGIRLAVVTFSNETASGWQQALFATPVAIASNTVYVASYHANNGHYSADLNYFQGKGVDNSPLHVLMNGVFGGNGVYAYGVSSVFPTQSYNAVNYWVDVIFQAGTSIMLTSIAVTPANPSIWRGASQQFTAMGLYSDGSARDITSQATWTSSNTAVATINAGGLATGGSAGITVISASLAGVIGSAVLTVQSPLSSIHYVSLSGAHVSPFTTWHTAATNIQAAIDAASDGDTVLVTNGVYATGGAFSAGLMNRVAITKAVTVQSVNGPRVTIIQGQEPIGIEAVRCAYVADGTALIGFTLTNGFTQTSYDNSGSGGGIYCDSAAGIVSNCTLTGNRAYSYGGGAYHGTLYNCTLTDNSATYGGGAYNGTLYNCTLTGNWANITRGANGGGAYYSTLYNCTLTGNSANSSGGGAYDGTLYNCTLTGNSAFFGGGGGTCTGTLYNCMLTGNSANDGGGARNGTLYNCTLIGNSSSYDGGGASYGTLYNCTLTGNSAHLDGGGAYYGTLYNCTLTGNSARWGGGVFDGTLYNCIAYYNTALRDPNYTDDSTLNYCCTLPAPYSGTGNFTNTPSLVGLTNPHLTQGSPCIDAGNNAYVFTAIDLDGEARTNGTMVDVGCDEFWASSCTGTLRVAILMPAGTNAATGYPLSFQADSGGRPLRYVWRFGDGTLTTNGTVVSHAYESPGEYSVVLEAVNLSGSVSATVTVRIVSIAGAMRYVATNGNDAADGMSWATAKATIQAGVAAVTTPGALVLVSNGVYTTGGAFAAGLTNRVAITNAVTVQSVNGLAVTIIQGQGPMGTAAVRCAYVADGAKLVGFTLTNGFTQTLSGSSGFGGGIYCDSAAGTISNCTLTGNSASDGGGAYYGTLYNCTLTGNSANYNGGGTSYGTLYNCMLTVNSASYRGGGAEYGTLHNCTLIGNSAYHEGGGGAGVGTLYNCTLTGNSAPYGGGAGGSTLYNCTLTGNSANYNGGGTYDGTLYNCTLSDNSASNAGGGAWYDTLYNCIVYYNTAPSNSNYYGCTLNYSCTTPDPGGIGNITNDPRFVNAAAGDYHLQSTSPCINAGTNQDWMIGATDIAGNPRLDAGGRVDMGAYEYQGISIWSNTTAPMVVDAGPDSAVELGVKFKSDGVGAIAGIRFYKAAANTGTHMGNLWTSNGTLLATATFTNETASGWQQALFAMPVAIASNTIYVASYHADNGHYSEDDYYFQGKGVDNPPLHMLMNGVFGGNGVYRYGASSLFPNQTWHAANYYVDVVFLARCVPTLPLIITTTSLPNGVSNTVYTAMLAADGGTTPYTWSMISGTLPAGLTLNSGSGVIGGTSTISGTFRFTVQVSDAGNRIASKVLSITIMSMPTVITIWPSTAAPGRVDDGPDKAVELGIKFKSDVAGTLTGIRFYKAAANTGTHMGNLWTTNSTRLATVTFSNETASGWQQALFATPVAIASNTVYVASYHANNGHYSADVNYFEGKGVDNPPLHVLANGVSGGNGVYRYGANSVFPNQTYNAANYWVDVVFQPASPASLTSIPLMAADGNVERWPWVWTSGDFSKECGASNLIDGNTNTMWIGNVGGEPWRVILDLGTVTDVTGIQLMFLDTAWMNKEIIGSRDREVWFDYLAETNEWVPLRYLYINFWGNEHGAQPPAIREIIWRDR